MRVLLSWLRDLASWEGPPSEAARLLTDRGLPVPGWEVHGDDAVLELEITSNRGDCLSHLGVARELAAAAGLRLPDPEAPALPPPRRGAPAASSLVAVRVEDPALCPGYVARVLLDSGAGAVPPLVARRLSALGVRFVSTLVDLTNYVMLERGQPLHAFDLDRLAGGRILVRRSRAGETLLTLDGRERRLPPGLLVIADAERPVAVAGVMGGKDSEVGPGTRRVVLESARFDPGAVRASAAALGLATDASSLFSRRVDPAEMEDSSARALALMTEATGGTAARGAVRAGPAAKRRPRGPVVALRFARLERILGVRVPGAEALQALRGLGFETVRKDGKGLRVRVPTHRLGDVAREEDLVEEVARSRGYERIPARVALPVRPVPVSRVSRVEAAVRRALTGAGFHEALTLPFTAEGPLDDPSPWTDRPAVRVVKPVRAEEPLLRRSLLGPLLRSLERNRARGVEGARLFEASTVFLPADGPGRPLERRMLAGALEGEFPGARGAVEAVLEALGLAGSVAAGPAAPGDRVEPLDPARTARLDLGGAPLGWAGELSAEAARGLRVPVEGFRVAAFELDLGLLTREARLDRPVAAVPAFPVRSAGMKRRARRGMTIIATSIARPITRSSSASDAAAMLVPSRSANHTRSPTIADTQPATRGTASPVASIPAV